MRRAGCLRSALPLLLSAASLALLCLYLVH